MIASKTFFSKKVIAKSIERKVIPYEEFLRKQREKKYGTSAERGRKFRAKGVVVEDFGTYTLFEPERE